MALAWAWDLEAWATQSDFFHQKRKHFPSSTRLPIATFHLQWYLHLDPTQVPRQGRVCGLPAGWFARLMWRSSSWPFSVFLSFKFVGPLSTSSCAQASTQIQYGTAKEQGLAYVISQTMPEQGWMMRHGDHDTKKWPNSQFFLFCLKTFSFYWQHFTDKTKLTPGRMGPWS